MAGATPLILSDEAQQAIVHLEKYCFEFFNVDGGAANFRSQLRFRDLSYIRETDQTIVQAKAKLANRYGDASKYQNVTVPVVMPQVEAAATYQASVFLLDTPIFGFLGAPGEEDAALQYSAIIEENSTRGGWAQQFMVFFKDVFKYNLGFVHCNWDRQVTYAVETDLAASGGTKPKQVIWEGNCIERWDPYNTVFDRRVLPTEMYKEGEFIGNTKIMSKNRLKRFISELPDKMAQNVRAAFESGLGAAGIGSGGLQSYYIPPLNPDSMVDTQQTSVAGGMNWMAWFGAEATRNSGGIAYKNLYEVTTLYARIVPVDLKMYRVPSKEEVQIWKFIIVNHQVLIYAERQTNVHNWLPVLIGQGNEDGQGWQTKSLAANAEPFQAIGSALVNSAMAARRRAISDRGLFDPSRVTEANINSDNPSAKIPVRPAAYGKPVSEAYYPIPFRDDQSPIAFQELGVVQSFADKANGQNQTRQGQFIKGNKNNPEWEAIQASATGRDQMTALALEAQCFTPIKNIIKMNTMQYQAGTSIFSPTQQKTVNIDPVKLRKSFAAFKMTDGLSSAARQMHGDEFAVALQTIGSSPQINSGYNIAPMFSYLMKSRNVDLKPFEKSPQQMAYEQAMGAWQQAAQLAASKVAPFSVPQPVPAQFGYVPGTPPATPVQ